MDNLYVAADGFTYEHDAIKASVDTHSVSSVTKQKLPHKMLTPNLTNLTFTVCIVLVMRSTNMETSNGMRVGRQWRQFLYKKKGKAVAQVTFASSEKGHVHLHSTEHSSTHGTSGPRHFSRRSHDHDRKPHHHDRINAQDERPGANYGRCGFCHQLL
ncbi:U-box domain-containing protein [Striga asiatica]|uniref:U-box domain-containing protein n=1 Tax=Striga asiatica TaxID=4170 RepID=A0A5A7QFY3_STRAF|nr:U-box domain-containing protein [Striga asiatica]